MKEVNKKSKPNVKKIGKKNKEEVLISDKMTPKETLVKSDKKVKKSQEVIEVVDTEIKGVDKVKNKEISGKTQPQKKPLNTTKPKIDSKTPTNGTKGRKKERKKRKAVVLDINSKKVFTVTENNYNEIKDFFNKRGDTYDVVQSGTTERIKHSGKTYIPFNKEGMIGSGYHLANIVRSDIKKWLEQYEETLPKRGRTYSEQCFNLNAIEKNLGKVLISIDINDCYWQTIYNKGYITEKTYKSGLKKKEWKIGRNASIGSLAKVQTITTYKNGRIAKDSLGKPMRRTVRREEGYQEIRHNVIGFVYDMFMELVELLGGDFFMFLTDCVFTTYEKKKVVEDFFKSYGYTSKCKVFEFTNLYRDDKVVEWIELKKHDTPKYYRYSLAQTYMPRDSVAQ